MDGAHYLWSMSNVPQLAVAPFVRGLLVRWKALRQGAVMPRPSFSLDVPRRSALAASLDLSSVSARPGFESRDVNDVMDFHFLNCGELASYILEMNPFLHETLSPQQIKHFADRDRLDLLRTAQSTFIAIGRGTVV